MLERVRGVLDRVVPPVLADQGIDVARRARLTVAFSGVCSAIAVLAVVVTMALEGTGAIDRQIPVMVGGFVLVSVPFLLRWTGSLQIPANTLVFVIFAAVVAVNLRSGALGRPSLAILALVPMIAIMVSGIRSGVFWTVLGLAQVGLLYHLTESGFVFPNPPPPEVEAETNAFIGGVVFLLVFGLAATYETLKNHAIDELKTANRQLLDAHAASERAGRELARAKDAAEAASRARSSFLASMSHEIRTPLNAVIGITSVLSESELTAEQRDSIDTIRTSGESLLSVINDILDFSKIESGKLQLDEQPFDPRDEIQKCVGILRITATRKGIEIGTEIAADLPRNVVGDAMRVRQVLLNLLSNAVKFTEEGEVVVTATHATCEGGGLELRLGVRDTGIGIPESQQSQLFESFRQVDASISRKYGGTGLGLAISKRLAERMGGTMWVESEEGSGSTFWFTLRVAAGSAARVADASQQVDTPSCSIPPSLRILVVDDNAINCKVARKMLERLGLDADVASDGQEACDAAAETAYDVILMDVQMPQMDGIEATRRIRARDGAHRPWIAAVTANASEEDRAQCLDAGMDDFVRKPFTLDELRGALTRAIGSSTSARSAEPVAV